MAEKEEKPVEFCGDFLKRLRDFPVGARQEMGYQVDKLQRGGQLDDFKPVKTVGAGVYEIRVEGDTNEFRSFYIAKRRDAIYIRHRFQKKTRQSAPADIALGKQRLKELPPEPSD